MAKLTGKIAVVTGASRGVGKGVALGLGEAGATVYVSGRTISAEDSSSIGTIYQTAQEVNELGGKGIAVRCDHRHDNEVMALFKRVEEETGGQLDILVNNVWGGYEKMVENNNFTWEKPFWEQPLWRWEAMFEAGVRAHYVASQHAARLMVAQKSGLIVNISFWAAQKYIANTIYGVAKAADDRMALYMAHELRSSNVAAFSLYPGLVRTEGVMQAAEYFDLSNSESPQFIGRTIAALATDPALMTKSGQVLVAAQLAQEYDFTDINGKRPVPATLETA